MFAPVIGLSIVGRALERGLVAVRLHHLLDALEPGERADERPYGAARDGLRIEPLAAFSTASWRKLRGEQRRIVLTTRQRPPVSQKRRPAMGRTRPD